MKTTDLLIECLKNDFPCDVYQYEIVVPSKVYSALAIERCFEGESPETLDNLHLFLWNRITDTFYTIPLVHGIGYDTVKMLVEILIGE